MQIEELQAFIAVIELQAEDLKKHIDEMKSNRDEVNEYCDDVDADVRKLTTCHQTLLQLKNNAPVQQFLQEYHDKFHEARSELDKDMKTLNLPLDLLRHRLEHDSK